MNTKSLKTAVVAILCAATAAVCGFGLSACDNGPSEPGPGYPDPNPETPVEESFSYTVAMPDGAPALAAAQLMIEDMQFGGEVNYTVVNSNAIAAQVSGGVADVCILPVNAAVQLAGSGEQYKLLGTVTHGNLYMLSSKHPDTQITAQNLNTLVGSTVGCIQLSSFVGNVFKMILANNDIPYEVVESVEVAKEGVVNLINIADPATGISPAAEFDYMVGAEPVVTAKINGSASAASPLKLVGDLQELYGEEGYPQAVMVAKCEVINESPEFIAALTEAVGDNAEWIVSESAVMSDIVAAINANYDGATSTLTEKNLNATVISRCAIEFVPASGCKQEVTDFITSLESVTGASLTLSDNFFYMD